MRRLIGMAIVAVGIGLGSAVAAPLGTGTGAVGGLENSVAPVQYSGGRYCERLRRACIYREERGERGEGNCRRYREECGGRASYCERLRLACAYKEDRGEVGEGNCRRYRRECLRRD